MISTTRLCGFLLIAIGVIGYVGTGAASLTALIPALVGAVLLILALAGRNADVRRHVMHAAVVVALLAIAGTLPRLAPALQAGDVRRPAVIAQLAMVLVLTFYVVMGVRSFIAARRARKAA